MPQISKGYANLQLYDVMICYDVEMQPWTETSELQLFPAWRSENATSGMQELECKDNGPSVE